MAPLIANQTKKAPPVSPATLSKTIDPRLVVNPNPSRLAVSVIQNVRRTILYLRLPTVDIRYWP